MSPNYFGSLETPFVRISPARAVTEPQCHATNEKSGEFQRTVIRDAQYETSVDRADRAQLLAAWLQVTDTAAAIVFFIAIGGESDVPAKPRRKRLGHSGRPLRASNTSATTQPKPVQPDYIRPVTAASNRFLPYCAIYTTGVTVRKMFISDARRLFTSRRPGLGQETILRRMAERDVFIPIISRQLYASRLGQRRT